MNDKMKKDKNIIDLNLYDNPARELVILTAKNIEIAHLRKVNEHLRESNLKLNTLRIEADEEVKRLGKVNGKLLDALEKIATFDYDYDGIAEIVRLALQSASPSSEGDQ